MAAPRSVVLETSVRLVDVDDEKNAESPMEKKFRAEKCPLTRWEFVVALGVFSTFSMGLLCVYLTMPAAEYEMLKVPRTLADLRLLKDHFATYARVYPAKFILGYCSTYIFMQTFMIPGTIFMYLLAGALFGVVRGLFLVVFIATTGASSCCFLSKLIGRPIVNWLWPEKLKYFQSEVFSVRDNKTEREVTQLHALFESYSNIAKSFYQFGITNCGYTISYLLSGNCYWSDSCLLHCCQSWTSSWCSQVCQRSV